MSETNNSTTPTEPVFENNKLELDGMIRIICGIIGFLALLSNLALCAVLLRNRQMLQRAYNIIIFALAIVDMLTGMAMIASTVLIQELESWPGQSNTSGLLMLLQRSWFQFVFGEISTFLIMCLTLERWFAVVRPIEYRCKFRKSRVYVYLLIIIITTLTMNINNLLPGYDPQSTTSKLFAFVDLLLTLILPLFVTWATYIHLWHHSKYAAAIQQSNSTKMEQRLVRMCATTAMFITVCWVPTEIYYLVTTFGFILEVPRITTSVDTWAMSNSIVNPWIYYFTNKEYKKAFKRLFNDMVFPVQYMVKCCRSDSLRVTNVENPEANRRGIAGTVISLTNFSLENE